MYLVLFLNIARMTSLNDIIIKCLFLTASNDIVTSLVDFVRTASLNEMGLFKPFRPKTDISLRQGVLNAVNEQTMVQQTSQTLIKHIRRKICRNSLSISPFNCFMSYQRDAIKWWYTFALSVLTCYNEGNQTVSELPAIWICRRHSICGWLSTLDSAQFNIVTIWHLIEIHRGP